MLAFLAPCAVALLPGYASYFVTKKGEVQAKALLIKRSLLLAALSITGFVTIYAVAIVLIFTLNQIIKKAMPHIVIAMGTLFIILGIFMLLGKNISLNLHWNRKKSSNEGLEAYLFGIAYAIIALSCLFPLFLVVVTTAIAAPSIIVGGAYILAYLVGMSLLMLIFTFLAVFFKDFLHKSMRKVMPYIVKVSGALMIAAGIYIIQYQWALI